MIPWTLLDTARVPGGNDELRLYRRDSEYSIRVGSYELMNSRVHASEDALASLVWERLPANGSRRILIGGLGMGFTLAAVLGLAGSDAEVVVSELVPSVIAWHRDGPLRAVSGDALDDPRVRVEAIDVARVIRRESGAWDAILLDVDNGPAGLTAEKNNWLYSAAGLAAAHAALREEGILAVWSEGPDAAFTRRLAEAGFGAEQVRVRGRANSRGPRYLIWVATRKPLRARR